MRRKGERLIESAIGYEIYYYKGLYFLDTYSGVCHGYETLAGACESAYYAGKRDRKEA